MSRTAIHKWPFSWTVQKVGTNYNMLHDCPLPKRYLDVKCSSYALGTIYTQMQSTEDSKEYNTLKSNIYKTPVPTAHRRLHGLHFYKHYSVFFLWNVYRAFFIRLRITTSNKCTSVCLLYIQTLLHVSAPLGHLQGVIHSRTWSSSKTICCQYKTVCGQSRLSKVKML